VGVKTNAGVDLTAVKIAEPAKNLVKLDAKKADVIFGEGAGELHVYAVRDLPV
jgi:hypothetical protein